MKIRLKTRDGGLVHEAEIPPFNEAPAVIQWGYRMFQRVEPGSVHSDEHDDSIPYTEERTVYVECFGYYLADAAIPEGENLNKVGDSDPPPLVA